MKGMRTRASRQSVLHQSDLRTSMITRPGTWWCAMAFSVLATSAHAQQSSARVALTPLNAFDEGVQQATTAVESRPARAEDKDPFAGLFARSIDRGPGSGASPQQTQTPPEPEHTGLAAIAYKTAADFKAFPRRKSTWVILGVGAAAAALAHPADRTLNAHLVGSKAAERFWVPGHIVGSDYVQAGTAVGLYVVGRYVMPHAPGEPRTNKVSHLGFDLLRAQIVSQAFVQGIKLAVRRDRPTGKCCGFPSGHATATFATAAVLERHFGYRAVWPTLAIATYVATSRLHDNLHYLSDVLFGAALGTATGWTIVGTHGRTDYALVPAPIRGGVMIALVRKPIVSQATK
jgi:membrane-associated phospholipid phosphatase